MASPSQGALKTEFGAGQPLPPFPSPAGALYCPICRSPALIALALPGTVADQSLEPAGTGFLIALSPGPLPGALARQFSPQCLPLHPGFPGAPDGKEFACNAETWVRSLGREDSLEKGMATHSSVPVFLPGESPWTEKPGRLQFMGWQKSGTGVSA